MDASAHDVTDRRAGPASRVGHHGDLGLGQIDEPVRRQVRQAPRRVGTDDVKVRVFWASLINSDNEPTPSFDEQAITRPSKAVKPIGIMSLLTLNELFVLARQDGVDGSQPHQHRIAVGSFIEGGPGPDQTAAAGLVFHNDLLAPQLRQRLRDLSVSNIRRETPPAAARSSAPDASDTLPPAMQRARRPVAQRRPLPVAEKSGEELSLSSSLVMRKQAGGARVLRIGSFDPPREAETVFNRLRVEIFCIEPNQKVPNAGHVCFGSKADMCSAKRHVRFTPKSGHPAAQTECQLRPKRTLGLFDEDKFSD